ncbi:CheR family methyltransferase [Methylobacterium sp. sgz302541]|uniref:CheR family methyltransferase n=1 Tax=unclassified Methylobacterium TaxID=2615210 RepID=UPI003D328E31
MSRARAHDPHADPGYAALKAAVVARTGHHYYADKDDLLFERLARRFRACGVGDSAGYLARLSDAAAGPREWAALEAEVTIGETFFFRYAEQFAALRGTILPGLVAERAVARSLRVWSAGCSTGAEPYSVAILLNELLGEALPDWHVGILGTDISAEALATARGGLYGRWALRTMPTEERLRYFRRVPARAGATRDGGYVLRPEFARMVRFERHNLLSLVGGRGGAALGEFDLILCRNVLIYFDAATVTAIVRALGERLRPGGWLLIGHAEPNPSFATFLDAINLPGTVAYRRPESGAPVAAPPPPLPLSPLPLSPLPLPPSSPPLLSPPVLEPAAGPPPPAAPAREEAAPPEGLAGIRALADAGDTARAWTALRAALSATPFDPALRLYEGLVAHSLGRDAEAERALRGAVYLDRDFVMAHYHLGLLLASLGRPADARRALDNAVALAETLPPDMAVPEGDGARARQVAESARTARAGIAGAAG